MADLDSPWPQAAFGELVGISQQAVSDLLGRGVLPAGETARVWLLAYCGHLREVAAGRDPDGDLAAARTRLANESADKVALENAIKRREYAPVAALEVVLGDVARQMSTRLETVVPTVRRQLPDLPTAALAVLAGAIHSCRELCAAANMADAERLERDTDDEDLADAEALAPAPAAE